MYFIFFEKKYLFSLQSQFKCNQAIEGVPQGYLIGMLDSPFKAYPLYLLAYLYSQAPKLPPDE